jgi:hypothetical protein
MLAKMFFINYQTDSTYLVVVVHNLNNLLNVVVGRQVQRSNVDLDEVVEEVRSELTDLLGPSGGPHASLSVRANLSNDLANLGLETHVQHAVSLVENQVGNTAKVGLSGLQHIDQTSGSGDQDLNTTGKVTDLGSLGNSSVDTGVADSGRLSKLGNLLLNLNSQLTGRSKDQDDRSISGGEKRLGVDVNDGGKTVSQGLSGSGLGNTDDIATRKGHRPTLRLNGSRGREALCLNLVHNVAYA